MDLEWDAQTDADLVLAYREDGVDMAFAVLVRRYQTRLYRLLLGLVRRQHLAEELCQRAFVKAAMKIEQLREPEAFYGWLVRIARAAMLDEYRKQSYRRHEDIDEVHDLGTESREPLGTKDAVRKVLARLSAEDREVLLLGDLESQSMAELAESLEISESAAKMRLKRARERFRGLYEEMT